jgi:hypothetical protein
MVSVYALICAATVAQSDCSVENAVDVIRLPDASDSLNCLRDTMMTLAGLAFQPTEGDYWKVICKPSEEIEREIARRLHPPPPPI